MRTRLAVVSSECWVCFWREPPAPVSAHHAFAAEFDANKPVNFKGTVKKVEWVNPHVWIHIDVKKPDGTVGAVGDRGRHAERAVPARLHPASLTAGTEIVVDGYRAKDGTRRANGRDLTLPTGGSCSSARPAPARRTSFALALRRNNWSAGHLRIDDR